MELPVAPASYQLNADALLRAAKRVDVILARTIAVETPLDGATVFTSRDYPLVPMANIATDLTFDPDQGQAPESLLNRIDDHFKDNEVCCAALCCADSSWPRQLAQVIEHRGSRPVKRRLHLLKNAVTTQRLPGLQILPARAMYQQLFDWYRYLAASMGGDDLDLQETTQQVKVWLDLLDEPRYELFLGRVNGSCVATAGVVTLGQIGVLRGLHVHFVNNKIGDEPDDPINRDTVARAMLTHVFDHCARAQFDAVVVELGDVDGDDSQRLDENRDKKCHTDRDAAWWVSLGFEAIASFVRYINDRTIDGSLQSWMPMRTEHCGL